MEIGFEQNFHTNFPAPNLPDIIRCALMFAGRLNLRPSPPDMADEGRDGGLAGWPCSRSGERSDSTDEDLSNFVFRSSRLEARFEREM